MLLIAILVALLLVARHPEFAGMAAGGLVVGLLRGLVRLRRDREAVNVKEESDE